MKINNEDLKKLYRSYMIDNIPHSRKKCPSTKNIINLFRLKLSEKKKSQIIDHVSQCYYCYQEFEFILHTLREEKKLQHDFGDLLHKKNKGYAALKIKNDKNIDRKKMKGRPFLTFLSRKYASLFLGILLIISVVLILLFIRTGEKKDYRGAYLTPIRLIEPLKGKHSKSILKFRWVEIKGSDYYIIELFDETLRPIWKSGKIFKNYTLLPENIRDGLKENRKYFWILSAYFPDGKKIESRIESFFLTE